jgi:hypothetical protein
MAEDLFTVAEARKEKDAVLNDVEAAHLAWMDRALRIISRLRFELLEFTAEDLRGEIEARMEPPANPHVWGALTNRAIKLGYVVPTGKYVPMLRKKSHGRRTALYRPGI